MYVTSEASSTKAKREQNNIGYIMYIYIHTMQNKPGSVMGISVSVRQPSQSVTVCRIERRNGWKRGREKKRKGNELPPERCMRLSSTMYAVCSVV